MIEQKLEMFLYICCYSFVSCSVQDFLSNSWQLLSSVKSAGIRVMTGRLWGPGGHRCRERTPFCRHDEVKSGFLLLSAGWLLQSFHISRCQNWIRVFLKISFSLFCPEFERGQKCEDFLKQSTVPLERTCYKNDWDLNRSSAENIFTRQEDNLWM